MSYNSALKVADQLEAIANWQNDQVYAKTKSGTLLKSAADHIRLLIDDCESLGAAVDALKAEVACPDCGCALPSDAEAKECGCDSPICSREGTLVNAFLKLYHRPQPITEALERSTQDS